MRTISIPGLAIVLGSIGLTPHTSDAQASLSAVQRSAIADSVATVMDSVFALSSRPDLDRMYSFFRANTTVLHNGKPEDWTEHQAGTRAFYGTLRSVDMHPLAHEIDVLSPSAAIWRGQFSYAFTDRAGHVTSGIAASTWVLARDSSGWRIVHLHMSDPPASVK
jgi:hypothetical protein